MFCIRTPNKLGYVGIASFIVPNSLHKKLLKKAQPAREEIQKRNSYVFFKEYGFEGHVFYYEAEPDYLKFSYGSSALGYYLHKLLPGNFKNTLFAFG